MLKYGHDVLGGVKRKARTLPPLQWVAAPAPRPALPLAPVLVLALGYRRPAPRASLVLLYLLEANGGFFGGRIASSTRPSPRAHRRHRLSPLRPSLALAPLLYSA